MGDEKSIKYLSSKELTKTEINYNITDNEVSIISIYLIYIIKDSETIYLITIHIYIVFNFE
jgi:hypothetical protein